MHHDPSYKLLFSHAEMVEDLLRGFVHEEWVRHLDFSTLEKVSGSYVSDDLRGREDDIIWRVRWGKEWLYVYLLLEFQSTVDTFMAVRIMTYLGLLYQDLIRTRQLTAAGKLPPVLPLVLYNGHPRWMAATEIAELIENEGCYSETELAGLRNVVAAFFRLENSRAPEDAQRVSDAMVEWLQASAQLDLRRDFTVWLKQVFLPGRLPGVDLPEIHDLQEVKAMLEDHVVEWTRQWEQQGIEKGRQEGRQEGEAGLLLRLLERKFGPLDEPTRQRIAAADSDTLLRWGERLLTANSLTEVFDNA